MSVGIVHVFWQRFMMSKCGWMIRVHRKIVCPGLSFCLKNRYTDERKQKRPVSDGKKYCDEGIAVKVMDSYRGIRTTWKSRYGHSFHRHL